MMDPFDRFLEDRWPSPSQCGAAAAVTVCVLSLVAAAAGAAIATTHLIDRLLGARP